MGFPEIGHGGAKRFATGTAEGVKGNPRKSRVGKVGEERGGQRWGK